MPPGKGPQLAQLGRRIRVQGRPQRGRHRYLGGFLPLVDAFGVDVEGPRGGLGRTALRGQAQGFGAEGRIILAAFVRFWRGFYDEGKIPPCSVKIS